MSNFIDLTGAVFGRLLVLQYAGYEKGGETANISFYAELDAPVLSTKIVEIKEPIIEVV